MAPGGNYNAKNSMTTKHINHLYWWEDMLPVVELLPAGNLQMPTARLQVEWCYTTFHNIDRVKHVRSCHKTCKKTLETLAESIDLIRDTRINNGNIQHYQLNKVQEDAKHEMFCKHEEQYVCKLLNIIFRAINWRKFERSQSARCSASTRSNTCANCAILPTSARPAGCKNMQHSKGNHHCCDRGQCKYAKLWDNSGCHNDKGDNNTVPPKHKDKALSPAKCTASTQTTPLRSATQICEIKHRVGTFLRNEHLKKFMLGTQKRFHVAIHSMNILRNTCSGPKGILRDNS